MPIHDERRAPLAVGPDPHDLADARRWGAPPVTGVTTEDTDMRGLIVSALCAGALLAAPVAAEARGCIKGALVGGLAGHAVGHGVLGAVGGCVAGSAISRHRAVPSAAAPMAPAVAPVYR